MKYKKLIALIFTLIIPFSFCGCIKNSKEYSTIKTAQANFLNLTSGKILVYSTYKTALKEDGITTEFSFKNNENGGFDYCQMQYDNNQKPVYCQYKIADKSEQWLLGKGWEAIALTDYTKDNPHQFIEVMTAAFPDNCIKKISVVPIDSGKKYIVETNAAKLTKERYKDAELTIISETITYTLNEQNELCYYEDVASIKENNSEEETTYSLAINVVEKNTDAQITKPELK